MVVDQALENVEERSTPGEEEATPEVERALEKNEGGSPSSFFDFLFPELIHRFNPSLGGIVTNPSHEIVEEFSQGIVENPFPYIPPAREVVVGDPYFLALSGATLPWQGHPSLVPGRAEVPSPLFIGNHPVVRNSVPRHVRDRDGYSYVVIDNWVPVWFPVGTPHWVRCKGIEVVSRWKNHWMWVRGYYLEQAQTSPGFVSFPSADMVCIHISLWKDLRTDRYLLLWSEEADLLNGYLD
jgi:hypothetical protein